MLLLTNGIRFPNPPGKLFIQIFETVQTKRVQVVSWRKSFDARETGMLKPAREYEVPNYVFPADLDRDKRHPHLKCDPSFLWKNFCGPAFLNHPCECVEQLAYLRTLPNEV